MSIKEENVKKLIKLFESKSVMIPYLDTDFEFYITELSEKPIIILNSDIFEALQKRVVGA